MEALRTADAPLADATLGAMLGVQLPLPSDRRFRNLGGAWRPDAAHAHLVAPTRHRTGQRFFLARVLAGAASADPRDRLLAVTATHTASQKASRAFAIELLCPWSALDALTDQHGTDDEGIATAAEHFEVSELAIRSSLVNHGKVSRDELDGIV